jgi:hypothetical protein
LACHLQIDADPDPAYHFDADPDPVYHFDADADPDPDPTFQFDADPEPQHCQKVPKLYKKGDFGAYIFFFYRTWNMDACLSVQSDPQIADRNACYDFYH